MGDWEYVLMSKSRRGGRSMMNMRGENEEFEEEDMWGLVRDREAADPSRQKMKIKAKSKEASSAWHHHHSASKLIPRASAPATIRILQQSSAPMSIPDWSKIYGSKNGSNWLDHQHGGGDMDDDDDGMVPPHEWVARKLGGTQISSFSMCEGIGRTLKGRDLSKVRNAVLTKTGFLE